MDSRLPHMGGSSKEGSATRSRNESIEVSPRPLPTSERIIYLNKIFFTADTHLGHHNIIKYMDRPWKNSEEMDEGILEGINSKVGKGDTLYHLGDVGWSSLRLKESFLDKLKCKNIHLILGNHDKPSKKFKAAGFQWVGEYKELHLDEIKVILSHYPFRSWNWKGHGSIHLHGHCHGSLPTPYDRSLDVGVDVGRRYLPYSWEEIKELLLPIPLFQSEDGDHHKKEKAIRI